MADSSASADSALDASQQTMPDLKSVRDMDGDRDFVCRKENMFLCRRVEEGSFVLMGPVASDKSCKFAEAGAEAEAEERGGNGEGKAVGPTLDFFLVASSGRNRSDEAIKNKYARRQ